MPAWAAAPNREEGKGANEEPAAVVRRRAWSRVHAHADTTARKWTNKWALFCLFVFLDLKCAVIKHVYATVREVDSGAQRHNKHTAVISICEPSTQQPQCVHAGADVRCSYELRVCAARLCQQVQYCRRCLPPC